MYYSAIGILAALVLLIDNRDIIFEYNKTQMKPVWKTYRRFLIAILVYLFTDIFWGAFESLKNAPLLFADTTLYFVAISAGILLWTDFAVEYLEEDKIFGRLLKYAGRFIAGAIAVLSVINIFIPILFTVDAAGTYKPLPLRYVMLLVQIMILLLITFYSASESLKKERHRRSRYMALMGFSLTMTVFLFLQLLYPYLPFYSVAYLLGTCMLHTYVISDEKEDYMKDIQEAERIKEMEHTIASMLDNMPCMTFSKDISTGEYLLCNQAFARFVHKDRPEDVAGHSAADLFGEDAAKELTRDDQIALSMDKPFIIYTELPDGSGVKKRLHITKLKYTNAGGQQCLLGLMQDETDTVHIRRERITTEEDYEKARDADINISHIAETMASSYTDICYVNTESEEFIEYHADRAGDLLKEVRRGWHFFEECAREAKNLVHPDDLDTFLRSMDRKKLMDILEKNGVFVITYRQVTEGRMRYVTMRVTRMKHDERYIVLAATDVDEYIRQQRIEERMSEEQTAYSRISALAGDFLGLFVIDPETDAYREFNSTEGFQKIFSHPAAGSGFFSVINEEAKKFCHPDDLERFLGAFTKDSIIADIKRRGMFTLSFRIMLDDDPRYVQVKAAMVEEKEGSRLVIGISDIDEEVSREESYARNLSQARIEANVDALTRVKNRHAYLMAEDRINVQIRDRRAPEFALVILDVNDLKKINDTLGHNAGDQYIIDASRIICNIFDHSPVFRVGGDEFAVITQGSDYAELDDLMEQLDRHNEEALRSGGIIIASGMARYEGEDSVAPVFERADQNMYRNKSDLKERKKS